MTCATREGTKTSGGCVLLNFLFSVCLHFSSHSKSIMAAFNTQLQRGASDEAARLGSADSAAPSEEAEPFSKALESPSENPLAACHLGVLTLQQPTYYAPSGFISTASGTRVSRKTLLFGSQNVTIAGTSVLSDGVVLRGDLAAMRLGRFVWLGKNTVLQPCSCRSKGQLQHVPMTVGDCCIIEDDCVVQAASLGSCVEIGPRCVIGNRCLLKDHCILLPDSVLPPDTIVPAFTVFGGVPARLVGELPEAWALKLRAKAKTKYRLFVPDPSQEDAASRAVPAAE
ncbi:hypothetical protein Esti_000625 [Eimeria stiedai]